jgi:hypothetical protein
MPDVWEAGKAAAKHLRLGASDAQLFWGLHSPTPAQSHLYRYHFMRSDAYFTYEITREGEQQRNMIALTRHTAVNRATQNQLQKKEDR